MYRPIKKRRKYTFDVERISDTHYAAKASKDFDSDFRVKSRHYEFPISDASVLKEAEALGMEILLPPDRCRESYEPQSLDFDLDERLYDYQKEDVLKAAAWGRAFLGLEMGCGKTAIAIALMKHFGGRALVVCPSYLCKNWIRECSFWHPELDVQIVKKTVPEHSCVISYDLTHRRQLGTFNVLILDESHYMKNKSAKRTKALMRLARMTPHVFLLSGTPAPNRPVELWTQLAAILGVNRIGTYTSFTRRYCGAKQSPLGFVDVSGATHKQELAWFMKSTCLIRRLKRDVLDLPKKTRCTLDVDVPQGKMKKKFARWREINRLCMQNETHELIFERKALVSQLFMDTANAKVDVIKKICADLPPRTLVFFHHQVLGKAIEESLPECMRIDGATPPEKRDQYVQDFQEGRVDYCCLSMLAAGTGVTLTRANNILFAELFFVPGVMLQAEDRAHRIGLDEPLTVTYVLANGSLDAHMFKNIRRKLSTLDRVLDNRTDRVFMN
jgi:SWI/SNF-related matrix-associated actin-dependent regulator 1 of chromatin subfamily A